MSLETAEQLIKTKTLRNTIDSERDDLIQKMNRVKNEIDQFENTGLNEQAKYLRRLLKQYDRQVSNMDRMLLVLDRQIQELELTAK